MQSHITPYLMFDKNCREAMTFYKECFGGELVLQTVGESPVAAQMDADKKDDIIHGMLTSKAIVLMASDNCNNMPVINGTTVSLCVTCTTEEEINTFFTKLSAGGQVGMPLKTEF